MLLFFNIINCSLLSLFQAGDTNDQNRQNENIRIKTENHSSSISSSSSVVIAEPDSTTSSYCVTPNTPPAQAYYGNNVILTPCGWTTPSPQPQIVKTVNLMVNKSVKVDCTDLPLTDLETIRFFFNLGIDVRNISLQKRITFNIHSRAYYNKRFHNEYPVLNALII